MLDSSTERADDAEKSYIDELARLLFRSETSRYIAMLHAYCDESYDGNLKTTPLYVVAGFVGIADNWKYFESLWRESMKSLRIEAFGCHAAKCANGAGPYKGMSGERRAEIQYRLIVDIAASNLYGMVSVIDMAAYRRFKDDIGCLLSKSDRQYNEPHVMAVRQCVQHLCLATEPNTNEPIAFVVDRNDAFGRRAKAWYEMAVKNPNPSNSHYNRLGPYAEDDRMRATGLQAADLLAYAGFRHANGRTGWQWGKLTSAVKVIVQTTGNEFWSVFAQRARDHAAQLGTEK